MKYGRGFHPFKNVGRKIQNLAKVIAWLFFIGGIVTTIVGIETIDLNEGICLAIGIAATVLAFPSTWTLFGFGCLVENMELLVKSLTLPMQQVEQSLTLPMQQVEHKSVEQIDHTFTSAQPAANDAAIYKDGVCAFCEAHKPVAERMIRGRFGTRYRMLCDDCYANCQAQDNRKTEM